MTTKTKVKGHTRKTHKDSVYIISQNGQWIGNYVYIDKYKVGKAFIPKTFKTFSLAKDYVDTRKSKGEYEIDESWGAFPEQRKTVYKTTK